MKLTIMREVEVVMRAMLLVLFWACLISGCVEPDSYVTENEYEEDLRDESSDSEGVDVGLSDLPHEEGEANDVGPDIQEDEPDTEPQSADAGSSVLDFEDDQGGEDVEESAPDTDVVERVVTYSEDIQPMLEAHCAPCHTTGEWLPLFAVDYEATQQDATLCDGGSVGECIFAALALQRTEGQGCRTYDNPFHREGWVCMEDAQIDEVEAWVEGGMLP